MTDDVEIDGPMLPISPRSTQMVNVTFVNAPKQPDPAAVLTPETLRAVALEQDNARLRRLLFAVDPSLEKYGDDGELQATNPAGRIDYLRMTPDEISEALWKRGLAALAAQEEKP